MIFFYGILKGNLKKTPGLIILQFLFLYAVSILTGIGFTMSLFVGNLAFANNLEFSDGVKIGVLTGSLLSTLCGYFLLLFASKK